MHPALFRHPYGYLTCKLRFEFIRYEIYKVLFEVVTMSFDLFGQSVSLPKGVEGSLYEGAAIIRATPM